MPTASVRASVRPSVRPTVRSSSRDPGDTPAAGVGIEWTAPANAAAPAYDGYRIYKSTDSGATYSLLDTVADDVLSATVDATSGDLLYVTPYNDAGEAIRDGDHAAALTLTLTVP